MRRDTMEGDIVRSYFKYQKTWPQPVCSHSKKPHSHSSHTKSPNSYSSRRTLQDKAVKHSGDGRPAFRSNKKKNQPMSGGGSPKPTAPNCGSNSEILTSSTEEIKHGDTDKKTKIPDTVKPSASNSTEYTGCAILNKLKASREAQVSSSGATLEPDSILRSFETKNNYGTLYQLRTLTKHQFTYHVDQQKKDWFWPKEYKLWRKHFKKPILADLSSSDEEDETREEKTAAKPHPDLYGAFNSVDLHRQLREKGATDIQKLIRGWLVRKRLVEFQEKASELGQSWGDEMKEYLKIRSKVRRRLHVLRNDPELDLRDVTSYLEQKKVYEEVFKRLATLSEDGRSLPAQDLREFFNACGLNPSDREIEDAFKAVFGGSSEIDVVILLDKTDEFGPLVMKSHLRLADDILTSLVSSSVTSRIYFVPFDEEVDDVITFTTSRDSDASKELIQETIGNVKLGSGPRNTHLGLEKLRECFKSSSPGSCKIGLVVTSGVSANPNKTKVQQAFIRRDNINIFSIGLGQGASAQDVASQGNQYVAAGLGAWKRMSSDVLEAIISKSKFFTQNERSSYTDESCRPLTKEEVLEILWTIYPPKGVAARHQRRSTWLHPIIDNEEASPSLEEEMNRKTSILPCIRLLVETRLARDGFLVLPTEGHMGAERYHDVDKAVMVFQQYLQSGKFDKILNS